MRRRRRQSAEWVANWAFQMLCAAPHTRYMLLLAVAQGKLELRSWRDEEKLARDRSRKRVLGRAGSEEPAEEEVDGSDQVQRPSKIRVTTRVLTDREMQERDAKRRELLPVD